MSKIDRHVNVSIGRSCVLGALAGCAYLAAAAPALAESPDRLNDHWGAQLGTFILDSETELRVDGDTQQGTPVDWDNTFGSEGDKNRFRFDGYWRFAERHKLRAMAFSYKRDNSTTFNREIEWEDQVYPVGAIVEGELKFAVYELAYEYAFLRRDSYELGASFGVHWATLDTKLKATFEETTGGTTTTVSRSGDASVDLPLPVIGLHGMWGLGHDFWIDASAQLFALSIDQYDGNLQDYRINFIWQPNKWAGVGIGYNRFSVDVDVDADKFKGSVNWNYSGPQIYYTIAF
jgi:hypothetical protein